MDRTVRLKAALTMRELPVEAAIRLIEHHIRRNKIAQASHKKTWQAKHEGVEFLLL